VKIFASHQQQGKGANNQFVFHYDRSLPLGSRQSLTQAPLQLDYECLIIYRHSSTTR
jgi:hypothetical protein